MSERELAQENIPSPYFESDENYVIEDDGTREMGPLYPFIISGGSNTERYYFTHLNDKTDFKFNIRPMYFSDESNYTVSFPKRINEIIRSNVDAKIFCVFDWDTIYNDKSQEKILKKKHEAFIKEFQAEILNGTLTLCPSMPSIEYWFLLHFEDYTGLLRNYSQISKRLAQYIKPYFSDPTIKLKKLLKSKKYLQDPLWVVKLCEDDKIIKATHKAEVNILQAVKNGDLDSHSYSYVYKIFKSCLKHV